MAAWSCVAAVESTAQAKKPPSAILLFRARHSPQKPASSHRQHEQSMGPNGAVLLQQRSFLQPLRPKHSLPARRPSQSEALPSRPPAESPTPSQSVRVRQRSPDLLNKFSGAES